MPSGFAMILKIKYKRFMRWTESEGFMQFIAKVVALFVTGIMVFSIFVVLL